MTTNEMIMPAISPGFAPVASCVGSTGVAELLDRTSVEVFTPVVSFVCSMGVAELLNCTIVDTK